MRTAEFRGEATTCSIYGAINVLSTLTLGEACTRTAAAVLVRSGGDIDASTTRCRRGRVVVVLLRYKRRILGRFKIAVRPCRLDKALV